MSEKRVVISMDSHVEFYVDTKSYLDRRWHETFDYATAVERRRFEATRKWRPQLIEKPRMSGRKGESQFYVEARPLNSASKSLMTTAWPASLSRSASERVVMTQSSCTLSLRPKSVGSMTSSHRQQIVSAVQ